MRFEPSPIPGLLVIETNPIRDERGSFARTFCEHEFAAAGIDMRVTQMNLSRNVMRHTLRGMHYQAAPHGEPKVVQCVRGAIWDAVVDLRPGSSSYCRWFGTELSSANGRMLYIPDGCAHGFITLEPESDVNYLMGAPYVPGSERGVRWNDPAFAIAWPAQPALVSERDASYPDFVAARKTQS